MTHALQIGPEFHNCMTSILKCISKDTGNTDWKKIELLKTKQAALLSMKIYNINNPSSIWSSRIVLGEQLINTINVKLFIFFFMTAKFLYCTIPGASHPGLQRFRKKAETMRQIMDFILSKSGITLDKITVTHNV